MIGSSRDKKKAFTTVIRIWMRALKNNSIVYAPPKLENQTQIFEHVMVHKLLYTSIGKSGVSIEKYTIEC